MKDKLGKPVSQRQLRVGEMIKQSLGMIFVRNEAKVPNLETNSITVTEVKMSQDLKIASIFREKNQVKQVSTGQECGIILKDFNDYQKKDIIEVYNSTSTQRMI